MPISRIFVSAGEASGDAYGAALVQELRERAEKGPFEGLGGPRMKAEGVLLVADSSHWGAISIAHALPLVRRVLGSYYRAKRVLSIGEPGLFVPIDFGYVNIRLAGHAKAKGWRVLYFVPPGSWRRHKQGKDLPAVTHRIVTPFSWSAEILERMGANVRWFGHPIKSLLQKGADVPPAPHQVLAVLPGSRAHEIENNLPIIAEALKDWPHPVEFALAPSADAESIRSRWPRKDDTFTIGDTVGVLRRARAAVVCSGTATLEAALLRVPLTVVYQADEKMRREERILTRLGLFRRPEYVALPNILLQRPAVPETIDRVDPAKLRAEIERLWEDSPEREKQLADFEELDRILGPADAIAKTAEWARELMEK
jgi:lipid-A-disaccharide synthase